MFPSLRSLLVLAVDLLRLFRSVSRSLTCSRRQATSVTGSLRSLFLGSMLNSFVLPLLALFSFLSCVAAQSAGSAGAVCSASHYSSLACLTSHGGAASLCAKLPRQTATLTVTTTTLNVNSITLTAHATSQTTVRITSTQMSTIYVTR
jgi:hypothetical protein